MRALVIAYGNTDRQDDGVAWHILRELAQQLGAFLPLSPAEECEKEIGNIHLRYMLQLIPEIADDFQHYDRVVFIDAHTGNVKDNLHIENLPATYQPSPLTHHLTPSSCLAIAEALHHTTPQALLVSVRGYEFGFSSTLSENCARLVPPAAGAILEWLG